MADKIAFYQIYFKDEQKKEMYDFAIPYFNEVLTDYFENSVISEVVPKCNADFISVCSWRLKKKRGDCFRLPDKTLTLEKIETSDFDIAILTPRSPTHNVMAMASHWHGRSWDDAISDLRQFIKVPKDIKHAIYENHFIARGDIYKAYVTDCLLPCIDYMSTRDVYFADSGYRTRKTHEQVLEYQAKTGRSDWPISTFILERLFSIYINDKNYNVINL
jgi:hypothetical protein